MSVGSRDSERLSRRGAWVGVLSRERAALKGSHEDPAEDSELASDLAFLPEEEAADGSGLEPVSDEKNSRNFWTSGSTLGSLGAVLVEDAAAGLSCAGDDGLAGDVEAQSQPMMCCGVCGWINVCRPFSSLEPSMVEVLDGREGSRYRRGEENGGSR